MLNVANQFSHEELQLLDEILGKTKLALVRSKGDEKVSQQLSSMLSKIRTNPFYKSNSYEVTISVTFQKKVNIVANSPAEALEIAQQQFRAGEITLNTDEILDTKFEL